MSIPPVVAVSLTAQARSQKVRSGNYGRQLQSFHDHIVRPATGSFSTCFACGEHVANRWPLRRFFLLATYT